MKKKEVLAELATHSPSAEACDSAVDLIEGKVPKPKIEWKVDCGGVWYRTGTKQEAKDLATALGYPDAKPEKV